MKTCLFAVAAVLALTPAGVAHAAPPDGQAPHLRIDPYPHYVTGSTMSGVLVDDGSGPSISYDYVSRVQWSVSDASGICSQSINYASSDNGGEYLSSPLPLKPAVRGWNWGYDDYREGKARTRFEVTATDCAGNTAVAHAQVLYADFKEDSASSLRYAGSWSTAVFAGFSGGTTHHTQARGASATQTVSAGPVGLVMEKGPTRGAVDVYLDGKRVATVSTYAPDVAHRTVVWQSYLPGTAKHTLKLVNKATAGHPRVDLDVVLTGLTSFVG